MPAPRTAFISPPKPEELCLMFHGEVWAIRYWPGQEFLALGAIGSWADDPDVDFTDDDANVMADCLELRKCEGK